MTFAHLTIILGEPKFSADLVDQKLCDKEVDMSKGLLRVHQV